MNRGLLRLLANDEYHFNSMYEYGFRPEVNVMKYRLFEPYIKAGVISVGDSKLLFLSATNSAQTVGDISMMLHVSMPKCHIMIWGDPREFLNQMFVCGCIHLFSAIDMWPYLWKITF